MSALDTARTIAGPIGDVGARFMLSPRTYARGAELGFSDIDFYFCGRGGVLPEVDSDLVVEEFGFFEPTAARAKFDQGRAVMEPARAAEVFIHIGYDWGRARLPEQLDAARLTELVRTVLEAAVAVPNGASDDAPEAELPGLFVAWAGQPWPEDERAAALHAIHLMRELRGGLHLRAVRAEGLDPHAAAVVAGGEANAEFPLGWQPPHPDPEPHRAAWQRAEVATDEATARLLDVLDAAERAELARLVLAAVPV